MRKILLFTILTGCAAADEIEIAPQENIGTLEQPIYMPVGFGSEGGGAKTRCDDSWSNGQCWVPDNTNGAYVDLSLTVDLNCTGYSGFMNDRLLEALARWQPWMESRGVNADVAFGACGLGYCLKCGDLPGSAAGRFSPVSDESHSTPRGTLHQYASGNIIIDEYSIYQYPFDVAPLQKQVNVSINLIVHELMHLAGIGHDATGRLALMSQGVCYGLSTCLSEAPWNQLLPATAADLNAIDCYNASSGTGDRCAD